MGRLEKEMSTQEKLLFADLGMMLTQIHSEIMHIAIDVAEDTNSLNYIGQSEKEMANLVHQLSENLKG